MREIFEAIEECIATSPEWRDVFPKGSLDWQPISRLSPEYWCSALDAAGFDVADVQMDVTVVQSLYTETEMRQRLEAAWGPMFPSLPSHEARAAFFAELAAKILMNGDTVKIQNNVLEFVVRTPASCV
eukprot:TRINITY_DN29689_c0_g1_i1.p2 TRINITY_DN29689_c0_g1~~TRINITY_DN29689_c0_g1_i1.p2  ORF type:complete len:128 (-),score=36.31 TRINITY_DN29689_c0_g1_i1:123-506(-)